MSKQVRAKKHLGQHFLKDENIAKKIADTLTIKDYTNVLEIGPGMGVLTKYIIVKDVQVIALDIDTESITYLLEKYPNKNLQILEADFLKTNITDFFGDESLAITGNFPYNISSQIVFKTLENKFVVFDTGWVPLLRKERDQRINNIDDEEKEFIAVIRVPGRKGYFQPENDPLKNFWFFVEPTLMEKQLKFSLEKNFYLEAVNNGPNGFPLGNQTRIYLRNNHLQYALTWLMIALGLVGVYFFASIKKK